MLRDLRSLRRSRSSCCTARFRLRATRRVMTGLRAGRLRAQGERQPDQDERQGRRLRAGRAGVHEAAATSTSAPPRRRPRTTPARRRSRTSARRTPTSPRTSRPRRGDPEARGAVQPGPDDRRHPGRRRHDVGLGIDPRHLARLRASCSRAASPPSASCRSRPCSS